MLPGTQVFPAIWYFARIAMVDNSRFFEKKGHGWFRLCGILGTACGANMDSDHGNLYNL